MDRGFEGPRAVKPGETAGLLRLLDRSFAPYAKSGMRAEYPQIYGRMGKFPGNHRIILHQGNIVAHVGVFPLRFAVPGGMVVAGGIGAVCTEKEFRGKGLMADLLGEAVRWMKEMDMPLSILWGNRYRYQRFGWEPAGCRYSCSFAAKALPALGRFDLRSQLVSSPAAIIGDLHSLHQHRPFRIDMDRETFGLTIRKVGRRVWAARDGGRIAAYAVAHEDKWKNKGKKRSGWIVDGWGGSLEGILSIIRAMLGRPETDFAKCIWPAGRARIPVQVLEAADAWSSGFEHMGQIRINNLASAMARLGAGKLVAPVRELGWDSRALARLLFGPANPANLLPAAGAAGILGRSLPLGLFLEPLDAI